jgi:hypothetical protein
MQRVRGQSGSAITILEPTQGRRRRPDAGGDFMSVELDVPKRLLVNFDVRILMDRLRLAIGQALRAGASTGLARMYTLGPITGSAVRARTWVRDESRSASGYFAARFPTVAPDIIQRETAKWVIESCPAGEALPQVNLSGGPLPGSAGRPEKAKRPKLSNSEREARRLAASDRDRTRTEKLYGDEG